MKKEEVINKFPEHIMKKVRSTIGLKPDDTNSDEQINNMHNNEVFERVLCWDGLINYGTTIRSWIEDIYGIELQDEK